MEDNAAFRALLSALPSGAPVYDAVVPNAEDKPPKPVLAYPYVLVRGGAGRPTARSLNRTVHASAKRWRVTVAGLTSASVLVVGSQVQDALEGARIAGQRLEQLPTYEGTDPLMDEDVKLTNGRHPFYAVYEWQVMS